VSSLLIGEAAAPEIAAAAHATAALFPGLERVLNVITMQQGPTEVLVHVKIAFAPTLPIEDVCHLINDFEARLREVRPEVRWVFVEPDIPLSKPEGAASPPVRTSASR
jgi:divalent metal cation (Fe/Co/Zn/Cd) transporter